MKQSIKDLMEQYLEIVNSPRNQENKKFWSSVNNWDRDLLRATPAKSDNRVIPFAIAPDNSLWHYLLGIDFADYYSNPEAQLESQLRMKIHHYNNFQDNFYFTDELYIWFSVITELSFFGADVHFFKNREPWIEGQVVKDEDDLDRLEVPDFYKSGLMPRIHQFYEVYNEYAQGKMKVMFPEWVRGPFCIAAHLRGMQDMLMDTASDKDFVHKFMQFMVLSNKEWNKERNKFLKTDIKTCKLWNDEVDGHNLRPDAYRELIFPYEKELSDHYGEVAYWHSCGNTDNFMEDINRLTNLKMYNVGPWTSYKKACEVFGDKTALDICIHPQRDLFDCSENEMVEKLKDIKDTCRDAVYAVRADAFMLQRELDFTMAKVRIWNNAAKKVLG